jgi:hypothetical protein
MRSGRLSVLQIRGVDYLRNTNVTHNSYLCTYDLYGPAPFVMFWMCADSIRGQVEGSWALEIETFLGIEPLGECHLAVQRVGGSRPHRDIISQVALVKDGDDLVARDRVK